MEPPKAPLHVSSKRVGDGSSAQVHIAVLDGQEVAAKVSSVQEDSRRQVRREARRYARLRHPGVLRCLGVAETGGSIILVTELMRGGSLFHALRAYEGKFLPREMMIGIGVQIARALAFVHKTGFSSGDMKSLNVLLSTPLHEADGNTVPDVKLCDFGLSRRLRPQGDTPTAESSGNEFLWGTTIDMDPNAVAGTFAYLAPECFERPPTTPKGMTDADVFALGVVLWELATCEVPWAGLSIGALMRVVREKRTLPFTDRVRKHVGARYVRLVENCWSNRPDVAFVAAELEMLFEASSPVGGAHNLYSNVSLMSGKSTGSNSRGVLGSVYSQSSLTSDESAAIASITSVEDIEDLDNKSFDISLTLFPDFAREVEEKRRMEQTEVYDSDSDSSSSSGDYHADGDTNWDNGEDVVVFGNVDDLVDVPLQKRDEITPLRKGDEEDSEDSGSEEEDEFMEYGQVVEIEEDYKSPAASSTIASPAKRVHFGETLVNTVHVSSPVEHAHVAVLSQKKHGLDNEGDMAEQDDDGLYMPEEFSGAGPGFLDATNELSEFSFTFQDGSSNEGSQRYTSRLKENIAESLEKRKSVVKLAKTRTESPPRHTPPRRPESVPLPARYSPLLPPRMPTMSNVRMSPIQKQSRRPTPVVRDYTSPPVPGTMLSQEIARFEDEDANTDVLTSVMQFSRFVTRRY